MISKNHKRLQEFQIAMIVENVKILCCRRNIVNVYFYLNVFVFLFSHFILCITAYFEFKAQFISFAQYVESQRKPSL